MGRKKIVIRPIADDRTRQVTLNKRKAGLFKKAYELSVLCKCDVALIVFDPQGRLYQYSNNLSTVMERFVEPTQNLVESHTNATIEEWIQRTRKAAGSDDDQDEAELPTPCQPEPAPPAPAIDTSHKKRAARPQLVIPPPLPPAAAASSAAWPPMRQPSVGFGASLPPFDPAALPGSPSAYLGLPLFSFPPPSPVAPVLHTANAGDLFVSSSMQNQLTRANSSGFSRQGSVGLMQPMTPSAFGLSRQLSASDYAALFAGLPGQAFMSRSNSQAVQDGLAAMATAATTAAPMIETAAAGTRAPASAQHGGPHAPFVLPGVDQSQPQPLHHHAFGAAARTVSRDAHSLAGFVTAAAGSTAGHAQHSDILTATYALQSLGGTRATAPREMMPETAAAPPSQPSENVDLSTSSDDDSDSADGGRAKRRRSDAAAP